MSDEGSLPGSQKEPSKRVYDDAWLKRESLLLQQEVGTEINLDEISKQPSSQSQNLPDLFGFVEQPSLFAPDPRSRAGRVKAKLNMSNVQNVLNQCLLDDPRELSQDDRFTKQINQTLMGLEGMSPDSASRVQNMLMVYSTGFHELIKDVASLGREPEEVVASVWKMFVFLLNDFPLSTQCYETQMFKLETGSCTTSKKVIAARNVHIGALLEHELTLLETAKKLASAVQKLKKLRFAETENRLNVDYELRMLDDMTDKIRGDVLELERLTTVVSYNYFNFLYNRFQMLSEDERALVLSRDKTQATSVKLQGEIREASKLAMLAFSDVENAKLSLAGARSNTASMLAEIRQSADEAETQKKESIDLQATTLDLERENSELYSSIQELTETVATVRGQVSSLQEDIKALQQIELNKYLEVMKVEQKVDVLHRETEGFMKRKRDLNTQGANLAAKLAEARKEEEEICLRCEEEERRLDGANSRQKVSEARLQEVVANKSKIDEQLAQRVQQNMNLVLEGEELANRIAATAADASAERDELRRVLLMKRRLIHETIALKEEQMEHEKQQHWELRALDGEQEQIRQEEKDLQSKIADQREANDRSGRRNLQTQDNIESLSREASAARQELQLLEGAQVELVEKETRLKLQIERSKESHVGLEDERTVIQQRTVIAKHHLLQLEDAFEEKLLKHNAKREAFIASATELEDARMQVAAKRFARGWVAGFKRRKQEKRVLQAETAAKQARETLHDELRLQRVKAVESAEADLKSPTRNVKPSAEANTGAAMGVDEVSSDGLAEEILSIQRKLQAIKRENQTLVDDLGQKQDLAQILAITNTHVR